MKRYLGQLFSLIVLCLITASYAGAQSNGTIKGVVKDKSGAVLPGASVSLINKATQQSVQTLTTEAGTYTFAFLSPGQYSLSVEMPGFKKSIRDNITVNVAQISEIDPVLEVGEVTSEI